MNTKYLKFILGTVCLLSCIFSTEAQLKPGNFLGQLELWLKADYGVTTATANSNVTLWEDQSGNARNYSATANYPTFNISTHLMNFQPSIDFRGGTQKLIGPEHFLSASRAYYVFYVSEQTASSTTFATVYAFNSARNNNYGWVSGRPSFQTAGTATANTYTHQGGNGNLFGINAVMLPNNTTIAQRSYMNGVMNTNTFGARALAPTSGAGVIGSSVSTTAATRLFNGNIQEIIILSGNVGEYLSNTELAKINTYFAVKYGISLDNGDYIGSDGTIIWDRANNSNYSTNIFGIGRDDASGFYQKQSRSVNNPNNSGPAIFAGSTLTTLNSQNTGIFADKQHLIIGRRNNEPNSIMPLTNATIINNGENFENGQLSFNAYNVQSPRYKAQITGASSMTVKLTTPDNVFKYLLVSKTEDFNNKSIIKIYEIVNGIAEIELSEDYKYFKFLGLNPGPGGVNEGLLLWLKADYPTSIAITNYPSTNPGLSGYPSTFIKDPSAIPTVNSWSDLIRDNNGSHTWVYTAQNNNHRRPVMENNPREMNYKPAVRFWSYLDDYGAYLVNTSHITSSHPPTHTAFFMLNNNFGTAARIYQTMFSNNVTITGGTISDGPSHGIEKSTNISFGSGRYRGDGGTPEGTRNLFHVGSTTIASYYVTSASGVLFRFNGKEENVNGSTSGSMARSSTLGTGVSFDRTVNGMIGEVFIYDNLINSGVNGAENRNKIESYLALKYGITLTPSPQEGQEFRFDYKFSGNTDIWPGQTGGTRFQTYYNRVAAVIRDDVAELNNRHSISTNVGSLLHLGVAGSSLEVDGHGVTGELENLEAVTFGDNNANNFTNIINNTCGDFDSRFNRIWLIHKITKNDRPVMMIVGAQNNSGYTIGGDDNTIPYYNRLGGAYEITLIVADSPENIANGIYKAVIPMTYLNGLWQCIYEFANEDTYITFGTKINKAGCLPNEDAVFSGTKTFYWNDWTRTTNSSNLKNIQVIPSTQYGDLGNNIKVTNTRVIYPSAVMSTNGFPRSINSPEAGSLEVRRRGASLYGASEITVGVKFNNPIIPNFSISGIGANGYAYEEVEIIGYCSNSIYSPILSYASNSPRYKITGNKATAIRRGNAIARNPAGRVNVDFYGGVDSITIKYIVVNRTTSARQSIYISPITLHPVPPPPPVNEDGLSFVKQVDKRELLTCEPVYYSFEIQNVNCDNKKVNFSDILPANMKWKAGSFNLDIESSLINPDFNPVIESNGSKLLIDNLYVPAVSKLILTAIAVFDIDAPSDKYENRANIEYKQIKNNIEKDVSLHSIDKETGEDFTNINATYAKPPEKLKSTDTYSKVKYSANDEIEVMYIIENPNENSFTDMFMEIGFNDEFTYVDNSLQVEWLEGSANNPVLTTPFDPDPGSLTFAGMTDGSEGFVLPATSKLQIKFKLKAPSINNLVKKIDSSGNEIEEITELEISYIVYSDSNNPCLEEALDDLTADHVIPYAIPKSHIISNRNITMKTQ